MPPAFLECDKLSFAHSQDKSLLQNLDLRLEQGTFTILEGESGAGKSTLLRLLVRLEEASSGTISYLGKPLSDYNPVLLRRELCLLPQTPAVFSGTVRHNLSLPFSFINNKLKFPSDDVMLQWLHRVKLHSVSLDDKAASLSIGQRQRLCLIRSLLLQPKGLLLDEPLSALDPDSRKAVATLLEELNTQNGVSILQVDHSGYRPACPHQTLRISYNHMEYHNE